MSNRIPPEKQKIVADILTRHLERYLRLKGEPIPDALKIFLHSSDTTKQADEPKEDARE